MEEWSGEAWDPANDPVAKVIQDQFDGNTEPPELSAVVAMYDRGNERLEAAFGDSGAAYQALPLTCFGKKITLLFLDLGPQSPLQVDRFLADSIYVDFDETFLFRGRKPCFRLTKLRQQ